MIYTEKVKTALKDIGKDNKIKNRAILEILENVASYHSDLVGYGANDIGETKLSWILLDWKLEVINRPKYGQTLKVNTWAKGIEKFFTYRDFEIFDEKNNLCAIATSKWALVDIEKTKMVRITEEIMDKYHPEKINVFKDEKLGKLEVPTQIDSNIKYEVIRKDIDLNRTYA